ncbi:MAG: DNA primase [Chloroflexi bacterium]|nr:DNA primase [Chloroflexota bacterium]
MGPVDEIKERLDIVEVIASYVPLQKAGRNYKALCPFHAEKTPSFVVFPENQRWHCFGACGEGGDVFTFVMKQEGWDFRTALEELARRAGVELKPRTPAQVRAEEEDDHLHGLLDMATRYYHQHLTHAPEAENARDYIHRRGLTSSTVESFLLGYSPRSWDSLQTYLRKHGYEADALVKAGLVVEREEASSTYDRFRDRLMIPIRDVKGNVVGFGARTLDPAGQPKYINSPQTRLFDKSRLLYGLDAARRDIRRQDQAVIVEGYMDVMQAHQAGFTNVVAQMGTALTESQLQQLQQYTRRLVLALDPDTAGVQATLRGVQVAHETLSKDVQPVFDPRGLVGYAERMDAQIKILQLPGGKDPDDLIREQPERWQELVRTARPVVQFYMEQLLTASDLSDATVKKSVADTMLPLLRSVPDPIERNAYAQDLARALDISAPQFLHELERRIRQTARRSSTGDTTMLSDVLDTSKSDLERYCLSALMYSSSLLTNVNGALEAKGFDPLAVHDFKDAGWRAIFEVLQALLLSGGTASRDTLRESLAPELQEYVDQLQALDKLGYGSDKLVRDLARTILRLREPVLAREVQELGLLIREAQQIGDERIREYAATLRTKTDLLRRTQKALIKL